MSNGIEIDRKIAYAKRVADLGHIDQALEELKKLRRTYPDDYRVYRALADVFGRSGRFEEAIAELTHVISLGSREPGAYFARGRYFLELGKNEEAIDDFSEVIVLGKKWNDPYYQDGAFLARAFAYARHGMPVEARRDCEMIASVRPLRLAGELRSKESIMRMCDASTASEI